METGRDGILTSSGSPGFLWYIPNQAIPGHRGEPVSAVHNSLDTLTAQARALEEHGWKGALLGAGWGRPDTFTGCAPAAHRRRPRRSRRPKPTSSCSGASRWTGCGRASSGAPASTRSSRAGATWRPSGGCPSGSWSWPCRRGTRPSPAPTGRSPTPGPITSAPARWTASISRRTCCPSSLTDIVDKVVPEVRDRGVYRTGYEGTTLREHLALPAQRAAEVARTAG